MSEKGDLQKRLSEGKRGNKSSKEMLIEAYKQAFYKANSYWPAVVLNGSWIDIGLPPRHYRLSQLPEMTARLLARCKEGEES